MNTIKKIYLPFARISLFIIYVWFGALKLVDLSPASPLIQALFEKTIPFMHFGTFMILFGLFEILIGILFLLKGKEKIAFGLLILHLIATTMPLFLVANETWTGFLVPTLEGQYIIKNLLILSAALTIFANRKSN